MAKLPHPTNLEDLREEVSRSIRVHHASGHFTHAQAVVRMIAETRWSTGRVHARLALPVTAADFDDYGTHPTPERPGTCGECGR